MGDLREIHGSRDVPISPDEVRSRKGLERKTKEARWDDPKSASTMML